MVMKGGSGAFDIRLDSKEEGIEILDRIERDQNSIWSELRKAVVAYGLLGKRTKE